MVTVKRHAVSRIVFGLSTLGLMTFAQVAAATHPRPVSAPAVRVSLVPAYEECTSPNRMHGPPLERPSCEPPVPTSDFLTVGTATNGGAATSTGVAKIALVPAPPGSGANAEVRITARITDVRCKAGTSTCGSGNATGGADYTGDVQLNMDLRLTDHYNAAAAGGGTDPATVVDLPQPASMPCLSTSDTSIGSVCDIAFSPQPASPGAHEGWYNGKRVVVGVTGMQVFDGGADGWPGSEPNTLFMQQGIFVP